MKNLMLLLLLTKMIVIGSTTDSTRYIKGNISRIDWFHDDSCTFKIKEESSPSRVPSYRLCNILEQAYMRSQGVSIAVTDKSSSYDYAVNFLDRTAGWPSTKVETESFTYQLFGTVEDVFYTPGDRCYIAIDTGFASVRNNKHFHFTMIWDICAKALNAFYSREKVIMMATVYLHASYTNEIVDLQLAKC